MVERRSGHLLHAGFGSYFLEFPALLPSFFRNPSQLFLSFLFDHRKSEWELDGTGVLSKLQGVLQCAHMRRVVYRELAEILENPLYTR